MKRTMIDENAMLSRDEYLALDETERMKVRLLAMKRAVDASAEAMRRHGAPHDISHVRAIPSLYDVVSGDGGFGESAGEYEPDAASETRDEP